MKKLLLTVLCFLCFIVPGAGAYENYDLEFSGESEGSSDFVFTDNTTIEFTPPEATVIFTHDDKIQWQIKGENVLEALPNGDFYVYDRLTTNDMEIYEMLKEWLEYTIGIITREYSAECADCGERIWLVDKHSCLKN